MTSRSLLLMLLLFASSCQVKKTAFPLPPGHLEKVENSPFTFEILWTEGNYYFVNKMVTDTVFLDHRMNELGIQDGRFPEWSINSTFISPFESEIIFLDSYATYNSVLGFDEVRTEIFNRNNQLLGTISGFPELSEVTYDDKELEIKMVDSWTAGAQRISMADSVYIHRFPYGGEFNLYSDNRKTILAKIIQGGILGDSVDVEALNGISYTVIFLFEPGLDTFESTVNILMGYFSFSDMHYYYAGCNFEDPQPDGSCPPLIVIE